MRPAYEILDAGQPWALLPGSCAFVLMAKAVHVGVVKTRLVPPLTMTEAAELSACFIKDMSANIAAVCADRRNSGFVSYAPAGRESAFNGLLPGPFRLITQCGAELGERLFNTAADLARVGFERVCLINSDSPTLPRAILRQAADALRQPGDRLVLGPAADGGYYLIGLKEPHRRLFEGIEWSTERVLAQTLERAAELGIEVFRLPRWYDVDGYSDLRALYDELLWGHSAEMTGEVPGEDAPATRRFLVELIVRRGRRRQLSDDGPLDLAGSS